MKKGFKLLGLSALVVLVVAVIAGVALAQGPVDEDGDGVVRGRRYSQDGGTGWSGRGGRLSQEDDMPCGDFVDEDGDGVCDSFVDEDGDGVCDSFVDEDGDGVCDLGGGAGGGMMSGGRLNQDGDMPCGRFVDEDGDGVCDEFVDEDGDGVCDNLDPDLARPFVGRGGPGGMGRGRMSGGQRRP